MSTNAESESVTPEESNPNGETDLVATEKLLQQTLGGSRGLIDSALPTIAFLTTFTLTSQNLQSASIAAGSNDLVNDCKPGCSRGVAVGLWVGAVSDMALESKQLPDFTWRLLLN